MIVYILPCQMQAGISSMSRCTFPVTVLKPVDYVESLGHDFWKETIYMT